jgi:hypothetical protein
MSEEERRRDFEAMTNALSSSFFETVAGYDSRYKVDAILLRDELLSRLPDASKNEREFQLYEHPTNTFVMERVCDDLERLAKSLPVNVASDREGT